MPEANNIILCLETATEVCSVAISVDGKCIAEKNVNEINSHGTQLTVLVENILQENNLKFTDLSAVAYSSGPGSYTGLRIGLSVAKGICYGVNIPLIDVSTLQHIASTQPAPYCFPMIDARRMEVYGALLDSNNEFEIKPFACIVDTYDWGSLLKDRTICFMGNGMPKSKEILGKFPNAQFVDDIISATSICKIANDKFNSKQFADLAYHVPFYLKEANVTEAKMKSL